MLLSLCLLLPVLRPSSLEICSAPGALSAPSLYLNEMSAQPGDSVRLQCSVFSQHLATRIIFCKDGEEVFSQRVSVAKATYDYDHVVTSSGNYSCGYEIKDRDNQVTRSQLSPAQHLSVTGDDSSSDTVKASSPPGNDSSTSAVKGSSAPGLAMSPIICAACCSLVLLLLVSAPIFTFVLEKQGLPEPAGLEEAPKKSTSIFLVERQWGIRIDRL